MTMKLHAALMHQKIAEADVHGHNFTFGAEDAPRTVEKLLKAYLSHRASPDETFLTFARRHDGETLRRLADAEASS